MLGEWPTFELALGTKRGPEGPSIVQESPAEGNRVKFIEVDLTLSNCPKKVCTASELYWGPRAYKEANTHTGLSYDKREPVMQKGPRPVRPEYQRYNIHQAEKTDHLRA